MIYDDVARVVDEIRLMWHRTVGAAELIHVGSPVSVAMRAVLEYLSDHGPHTVSAMARARSVSRQHIQVLVNDLLAVGLVDRLDNPDHARAPLIGLTAAGAETIDSMRHRERDVLGPCIERTGLTPEELQDAAAVIREIGEAMAAVEMEAELEAER